jgi:flagella basal body P-ring formation protein FlgA
LFTTIVEAKSVILLPEYCVKDNLELHSNFFDSNQSNEIFSIISLPKTRSAFSVPTIDIKKKFIENDYDVIDSSSGIIKFRKFCSLAGKEEEIAGEILRLFEEKYPCIEADFPSVKASSALPHDFKTYEIKEIILSSNDYRNARGSFQVIFTTPTSRDKKLYFRFKLDAKINVFKAKHNLHNDKILSTNDYEMVQVTLDKLPSEAITCSVPDKLMTKNYLRADSILTMQRFEYKKDVLRGANVRAFVRDGMLVIGTSAHVLQDGNIGDVVKIKTEEGKLLNAKLISSNKAIILE